MEEFNKDKIDEIVLALLYLNAFEDGKITRAWKSFDWDATDRLHEKGFISCAQIIQVGFSLSCDQNAIFRTGPIADETYLTVKALI